MTIIKMLVSRQRRNYSSGKDYNYSWHNELSLASIANRWQEIMGQPDSCSWLDQLRKHTVRHSWTTPFTLLKNLPLKEIAKMKKHEKIEGDVFMFIHNLEEKRAIAKFLARKGIDSDTLSTLFSWDVLENLPLDQNEQPEPARERGDRDGDQPPRPLVPDLNKIPLPDLNEIPPQEQDEAGDGGGE